MNRIELLPSMIETSRNLSQRQDLPRPYKCPLCEKSFHRLEHQTRHIRTHTGEKPHRCSHPGCVKRFSRSDELTRHLRIHSNPNSRRSGRMHQQSLVNSSVLKGRDRHIPSMVVTMPPPNKIVSRSAPVSTIASPNLSPTTPYSSYIRGPPDSDSDSNNATTTNNNNTLFENFTQGKNRLCNDVSSGNGVFNLDINLLASAATQVERDNSLGAYQTPRYNQSCCDLSAYKSRTHLPLPSHFKPRQPPTLEKVNHCIKRYMKRSRTDSPNSTAPSSPTFSHDSLSPTPDDTPLVTPAHSPRLRSHGSGYDLPSLRNLSLYQQHLPTLPPMEPNNIEFLCNPSPFNSFSYGPNITKTGSSLSDIILQTDGTQRKLPCPLFSKASIQDYQGSNDRGF